MVILPPAVTLGGVAKRFGVSHFGAIAPPLSLASPI
jgi:hypothetical protein